MHRSDTFEAVSFQFGDDAVVAAELLQVLDLLVEGTVLEVGDDVGETLGVQVVALEPGAALFLRDNLGPLCLTVWNILSLLPTITTYRKKITSLRSGYDLSGESKVAPE